ncbi:hypothetical protein [Stenotrophomonas sp.]|uniref:hypothetical protein n=1 Tax=Stenotrophomonas sp. TaxID=69392 RepID=UPI00289A1393|nr:hypothetical protein [Stenotrophomonas sp.]
MRNYSRSWLDCWTRLILRNAPPAPRVANWGYNCVAIWLDPPVATPGFACFTFNIYPELDVGGDPPQFSRAQLAIIMNHWRSFLSEIAIHGMQAMSGKKFEVLLVEA